MKTIIAAVDFSPASNNAVEYALELTHVLEGHLILVNAYEGLSSRYASVSREGNILTVHETAIEKLEALKELACKKNYCITNVDCVAESGTPYDVLISTVKKYNADIIVIGLAKETRMVRHYFTQSTAIKIARTLKTPTFIIPEDVKFSEIKKIGFACDVKEDEETETIYNVKYFSQVFNAELEVIKVEPEEELTVEKLYIDLFIENRLQNVKHKTIELHGTDVAGVLENYFNNHPADVIMISPKKHNIFYYLLNTSVTEELVSHAKQPILAIH